MTINFSWYPFGTTYSKHNETLLLTSLTTFTLFLLCPVMIICTKCSKVHRKNKVRERLINELYTKKCFYLIDKQKHKNKYCYSFKEAKKINLTNNINTEYYKQLCDFINTDINISSLLIINNTYHKLLNSLVFTNEREILSVSSLSRISNIKIIKIDYLPHLLLVVEPRKQRNRQVLLSLSS